MILAKDFSDIKDIKGPIYNKVYVIKLISSVTSQKSFKGCGMGPWLVLVSPCFRENVVATFKIGSFLCSLDNLRQKNVIVFSFGNQISKKVLI